MEVLVEMDYDTALDVMAKHYSVGRVHCQLAQRKVKSVVDHFLPLFKDSFKENT